MKKDEKHLSLRIDQELLRQFRYVAKYNDRSLNWMLLSFIKKAIADFEQAHGKIPPKDDLRKKHSRAPIQTDARLFFLRKSKS